MRRIITYIMWMVLLTVAVGCGETHYDSRLAAIDSIIESSPDSALALLRAMPRGSITRGDDRAYYALLLTEARYKCYDSIASTDTIDLALDHFSSNGDRLKLTRALIYKGAVLEELGNPTDAMRLYKQAEETALPSDFHSLGYVNLRMADMYDKNFAECPLILDKYQKALNLFCLSNDSNFQLICLYNIGRLYRSISNDSAVKYLNNAKDLAISLNNKLLETNIYSLLARAYYSDSLYEKQRDICLKIINSNAVDYIPNDIYYDLCRAYAKLGQCDSASFYYKIIETKKPSNKIEEVSLYITLCDMEKAAGNYRLALYYGNKADSISKAIEYTAIPKQLFDNEQAYDINNSNRKDGAIMRYRNYVLLSIICSIIIFAVIFIIHRKKMHSFITLVNNLKYEMQLSSNIKVIERFNNDSLTLCFEKMRQVYDIYDIYSNHPSILYNKLEQFAKEIKSSNFIQIIRELTEKQFGDKLSIIKQEKQNITDKDLDILRMLICGFSNSLISFYMGYKNDHYIYKKKKTLAAKLEIESIDEFASKLRENAD